MRGASATRRLLRRAKADTERLGTARGALAALCRHARLGRRPHPSRFRAAHPGTGLLCSKLAKVLGVSVEALLSPASAASPLLTRGGGPVGKVRKLFDEVSKLPRRQQDKIVEFLAPIVEEFKRKTG